MSMQHLLATWKPVDQTASQGNDSVHNRTPSTERKIIYPSLFPIPGAPCPPLVSPPSSWASVAHTGGGVSYGANYGGCNTTGWVPRMKNAATTMNSVNLPVSGYTSLGNGLGTAATSSCLPLAGQPGAALGQVPVETTWLHSQAVQGNVGVAGPLQQPGNTQTQNGQGALEGYGGADSLDRYLCYDEPNGYSQALAVNTMVHTCIGNSSSLCLGQGSICLDTLLSSVDGHPNGPTGNEIENIFAQALGSSEAKTGQPVGPSLGVSAVIPAIPQSSRVGPSPGSSSSTTPPTQNPTHPSPTGVVPSPASGSAAASTSTVSSSRAAGKRKRSESDVDGDGNKQRQEGSECTDQTSKCSDENQRKRKKGPDDEIHVCRICEMMGVRVILSRRDSLKRHINKLHAIFAILFHREKFDLLEPRRKNQVEDLLPWIKTCVSVQLEAQRAGAQVKPEYDLVACYPVIASQVSSGY